jgi:hypothetical protein
VLGGKLEHSERQGCACMQQAHPDEMRISLEEKKIPEIPF